MGVRKQPTESDSEWADVEFSTQRLQSRYKYVQIIHGKYVNND